MNQGKSIINNENFIMIGSSMQEIKIKKQETDK